ncbi:hypothetical protein EJ04DRAFT_515363 [Polyplosphaeria fusca]|uniref:Uncharacterized protein n=1 Tax=Polyplosphaeria fusca TaxID=682080 RepID=A0A9P4UZK0_9PLEO|nr:hypothetical protein EJ04DRAFT_515363 [Polyplosphaeria fusca]
MLLHICMLLILLGVLQRSRPLPQLTSNHSFPVSYMPSALYPAPVTISILGLSFTSHWVWIGWILFVV